MAAPKPPRTNAFISYSHKDAKYLAQLQNQDFTEEPGFG